MSGETSTMLYPQNPVVIVDDEEEFLFSLKITLKSHGITHVITRSDSREALSLVMEQDVSCLLLDINMPGLTGLEFLERVSAGKPHIPTLMLTAVDDVDTAVRCMKAGSFDYLVKPIDDSRLVTTIEKAVSFSDMRSENTLLKKGLFSDRLEHPEAFAPFVTESDKMLSVFKYIEAIGGTDHPILITGETGSGKEILARAVHEVSRGNSSFVAVNAAGLDDAYFSDTLFGHKKGAFTGADSHRKGLIDTAAGGTLFLDEVGDIPLETQVKLLRVLQDKRYYALGSDQPLRAAAKMILATNRDVNEMQRSGAFRQDLYYRLITHHIHIPPLRERMEDIPALVDHFLQLASSSMNKKKPTPPRELFSLLNTYSFPGNVRELEAIVTYAVSRHDKGLLSLTSFKEKIFTEPSRTTTDDAPATGADMAFPEILPTIKEMEESLIAEAFRRADNNQTIAAQLLGISRRALNNRLMRKKRP